MYVLYHLRAKTLVPKSTERKSKVVSKHIYMQKLKKKTFIHTYVHFNQYDGFHTIFRLTSFSNTLDGLNK